MNWKREFQILLIVLAVLFVSHWSIANEVEEGPVIIPATIVGHEANVVTRCPPDQHVGSFHDAASAQFTRNFEYFRWFCENFLFGSVVVISPKAHAYKCTPLEVETEENGTITIGQGNDHQSQLVGCRVR